MSQYLLSSGFSRTALSAAISMVVAASAFAQNTTAALGGRVTSSDGKPVAGALVNILHRESGSVNKLTTDTEGRYAVRGLRVDGPYTITVIKGNDKDVRNEVYLQLAETQTIDLTLGGVTLDAVVVTGVASSKFNTASMGSGTNIGRREIDAYASIGRNLQDYARTDPRLSQTDKERGEISALGQNSRYNSITIDGVRVSDTFGLEANNLPTTKQPVSIDAIHSVQVNLSNYDVTQQGYTGANINAVTKSGTNDLKGSVYYVYRDEGMGGQRFNRTNNTYFSFLPYKEDTKGFTLGGPILEDKLFFFASYEAFKSGRAQPEFGPVGSNLSNVAISQTSIDSLKAIAKDQYQFDAGDPSGPTLLSAKDYLLKLDWNINDQHRVNVRFARTEQADTNNGSFTGYSATGLQLTSAWWEQSKQIDTTVAQWFADWTPTFSTEMKVSNRDYNSIPLNYSNLPAMALQFTGAAPAGSPAGVNTGSRLLNFGTEQSRHFNVLDTKTFDGYFGATWALNEHELKLGGDLSSTKVYNAFFQNTNGNYTFSCVNSSATYTYTFGAINCGTATAAQVEAAILENYAKGRPSAYQVQLPASGGSLDAGIARWTVQNTGLFLQDTWTASNKLTITGGVRIDRQSTDDKPAFNAAAASPTVTGSVSGTTIVRNSGGFGLDNSATIDGQDLFQPRLGFNYALDGANKKRAQVRGGFGLFQGAAANVWLSNPYSNTGLTTRIIGCGGTFAACPNGGGIFSADSNNQPTNFVGASPAANVDYIEKGLAQPSVWKANLAYDAELPWGGLVIGAEWMGTKTKDGIYYKHLNLGASTKTGPDGRELFYTPQGYNTACWTATGSSQTTPTGCSGLRTRALSNAAFNNVLQAVKTSEGGGNAVTLTLTGPKVMGVDWNLAYTRTDATEVSPLTSSVSNSNFNARSIFNPNEEVASNSAYLTKDRVNASLSWSKAFVGKYKTTFGLFYEGRSGKPFSWTYANDLNGDGVSGNDLMYIPSKPQSGEVVFAGDTATSRVNEDRFWSIVESHADLREAKGGTVKRNGSFSPVVHNFDLRISQEVPGFMPKHKGVVTFDILNVGNLINKEFGRIDEAAFSSAGGQRRQFVSFGGIDASGKYVYIVRAAEDALTLRQIKGESQ
ncbi:MAG: TonB-dependent receptor, partial [Rhodoferax sp.]|nr:TonB-dependent receptor [Rhodoferax sp.]